MNRHLRISAALLATLMALAVVPALAGCGGTAASTSPSPTATQSVVASSAPTTYLAQAQQIIAQVGTTAGSLPDAVAGLSKTVDDTWMASGAKLNDVATQLGKEASSLAALTPPSALQPVQDAVVKGIQDAQAKVNDLSGLLTEQSATEATAQGSVQSQVDGMKAKLLVLSTVLSTALDKLGGTPDATPTP